jgi:hypothetical protein
MGQCLGEAYQESLQKVASIPNFAVQYECGQEKYYIITTSPYVNAKP